MIFLPLGEKQSGAKEKGEGRSIPECTKGEQFAQTPIRHGLPVPLRNTILPTPSRLQSARLHAGDQGVPAFAQEPIPILVDRVETLGQRGHSLAGRQGADDRLAELPILQPEFLPLLGNQAAAPSASLGMMAD